MYSAITHEIRITVTPEYSEERSEPGQDRYVWLYTIEIENLGRRAVQLTHRHWKITDARGRLEEVRGPGVVGEQPVLEPGESFKYTSMCPLTTPSGIMIGAYRMVDDKGRAFDVAIPAFSLDSPQAKRVLN
jgi:ApaG protein